jgi:hypothetical protein
VNAISRNINIQTLCGPDGTRNGTCPTNRGTCSINPLENNLWTSKAYCVCKASYYGENCQYGPLCNDSIECNGNGKCVVHENTNGTFEEKCVCNSGYFGANCTLNPCSNVTCQNNGTCCVVVVPDGSIGTYCKCTALYFGNRCQYEINDFANKNRIQCYNQTSISNPIAQPSIKIIYIFINKKEKLNK